MNHALKSVPVDEPQAPEGLVRADGEWYFEEHTPSTGITTLGIEETAPNAPSDSERRSILDLFKP
jgi:penicillin-binding protein 1A